jgi:sugar phosphate isomerase/epimerase
MSNIKSCIVFFIIPVLFLFCKPKTTETEDKEDTETSQERESFDNSSLFSMDNLLAWCIVPFDIKQRTPEERIQMLRELGFKSYAYDWRVDHLTQMSIELKLARENGIEVKAVWLWIDANSDNPGKLSEANEKMLKIVEESGLHTQVWTGFNANYFDGLTDEDAVQKGTEMVDYLAGRVKNIGCRLALYNHGDWFGEPANQVNIIKKVPNHEVGIIYNFHHAHDQIGRLEEIIRKMKPYLWVVNLNGMKKEGPKILPLGSGSEEKEMIDKFLEADYTGPWGILGHVEEADVKTILEANLKGLRTLY